MKMFNIIIILWLAILTVWNINLNLQVQQHEKRWEAQVEFDTELGNFHQTVIETLTILLGEK